MTLSATLIYIIFNMQFFIALRLTNAFQGAWDIQCNSADVMVRLDLTYPPRLICLYLQWCLLHLFNISVTSLCHRFITCSLLLLLQDILVFWFQIWNLSLIIALPFGDVRHGKFGGSWMKVADLSSIICPVLWTILYIPYNFGWCLLAIQCFMWWHYGTMIESIINLYHLSGRDSHFVDLDFVFEMKEHKYISMHLLTAFIFSLVGDDD